MKKNLLLVATAFAATMLMVGCAMFSSSKDDGDENRKKLNKLEEQARNPEKIEQTGEKRIDALADASTVLCERARKEFNKYLEQTRGPQIVGQMAQVITESLGNADISEQDLINNAKEIINGDQSHLTETEKKDYTPEKLYKQGKDYLSLNLYQKYIKEYNAAEDKKAVEAKYKEDKTEWEYIIRGEKVYKEKGLDKVNWDEKLKIVEEIIKDAARISNDAVDLLNGLKANGFSLSAETQKQIKALNGIKNQALFSKDVGLWLTDEYVVMKLAHSLNLNLGRLSN